MVKVAALRFSFDDRLAVYGRESFVILDSSAFGFCPVRERPSGLVFDDDRVFKRVVIGGPRVVRRGVVGREGADVLAVDPLLESTDGFEATKVEGAEIYDRDIDAAVLVTPQEAFESIDWTRFPRPLVVVDAWRTLDLSRTDHHLAAIGRSGQ